MIFYVCIKIINLSSILHRCRIVVSLVNMTVLSITTSMTDQCFQCVPDGGDANDLLSLEELPTAFFRRLRNNFYFPNKTVATDSNNSIETLALLSFCYEDTQIGKHLQHLNETIELIRSVLAKTDCAAQCIEQPKCRSCTIYNVFMCHLSAEDVISTDGVKRILIEDPSCIHFGMQKTDKLVNREEGALKEIRNDWRSGKCSIKRKGVGAI